MSDYHKDIRERYQARPQVYADAYVKALEAEVERWDLAYEDLKREYDHKCERVDALLVRVRELTAALREIRDQEWTENVLDPQWAARIAQAALAAVSAETEDDDE